VPCRHLDGGRGVAAISLVAAVSAFAGSGARPGGNGGGPAIVGFSPQKGSIRGGTVVHISGGGFDDVGGVSFGGHPPRSFQVRSENLISAVTPAGLHGAHVPVTVVAAGGGATGNRDFTFIGRHVPRLRGDPVERAPARALSGTRQLDEGRCLVARGPGTTHRPRRETSLRSQPAVREDPRQKEALPMTIVWILIVIILVLFVIALARRVL
jgi:hypothetical protein